MQKFESWLAQADQRPSETGRPLVSLCFAQSLDGCLTAERGRATQLSGPETKQITHRLRALHDGILVGVGTVLADDPHLTVRHAQGEDPQPVVLDSRLRTPVGSRLIAGRSRPAWIATTQPADAGRRAALEAAGVTVLTLPAGENSGVDLPALLDCLGGRGIRRLMVEGGAAVIDSFLSQGLVDLVSITIAPVFLGGLRAIEMPLAHMPRLSEVDYQKAGEDVVVWGRF